MPDKKQPNLMAISFSVREEEYMRMVGMARLMGLKTAHEFAKKLAVDEVTKDRTDESLKKAIEHHKKMREWLMADIATLDKMIDDANEDSVIDLTTLKYRREQSQEELLRCPDMGVCHHECGGEVCFRVRYCYPLSDSGDSWAGVFLGKGSAYIPEDQTTLITDVWKND